MNRLKLSTLLLAATFPLAAAPPSPKLALAGTYDTGLGVNGAEIVSVREKDNLGAITNIAGSVDLLNLSDPTSITLIKRVIVNPAYGTPNSVAIHPSQDYMLVASGASSVDGATKGRVTAYSIPGGAELTSALVGVLPDSVAISHNGNYAVVANEAEGLDISPRNNGGEGSLSLIRLQDFNPKKPSALLVFQIPLLSSAGIQGFSTGRADDLGRFPITNLPATLEPESVAFSQNSQFAFVTLQENNGVAVLDLKTLAISYIGLGQTTHAMDIVNGDGYHPEPNVTAFREPDGIALFKGKDGIEYFVTADEGDTRTGVRGGRTVSLFNAKTGEFVADTGNQLDQAAADAGVYPDSRSERGGSEPEVLDVADYKGHILVAVGLERAASVALIDVTDATAPTVIDLAGVGNNPEGIKFYKVNGRLYVLAANEASGTLSALLVE
jgi:DNA-binding beta-propeller fold protein YncE